MAATGGTTPYTWLGVSGLPPGVVVSSAGVWSGTPTAAGTYAAVVVRVTDAASVVTNKTFSITITPPLVISTATLSGGQKGVVYASTTMAATGGTTPYTWAVTSGLPPGLSMSVAGVLSGTPTADATYSVVVRVTDAASVVTNKTFSITISPAAPLVISTVTLPDGQKGVVYTSTTMAATGGLMPYTWTVTSGLPPGLSMSAAGVLSGTPTADATYNIVVRVTDSSAVVTNKTFSVKIKK
jgi:hypothetical protein